jgi:putative tryptophan/tyrosine transport system substrate-binding protein
MRRREFIAGLGAAAWPAAARAQQGGGATIGLLFSGTREAFRLPALRKGLSEMGFVEGRNLAIEYRFADDDFERLPVMAADLVRRGVAAILATGGTPPVMAAKAATTTIPIVFLFGGDPVATGVVASFNRPEGNVTGVSFMNESIVTKRLGLLHDLVPSASRFAMLVHPTFSALDTESAKAAAAVNGYQVEFFTARNNEEIGTAFARMVQWRAEALHIGTGPLFGGAARQLAASALIYRLPASHFQREIFVEAGGLMSYGSSLSDSTRLAGIYVGRVLKGEKPADLPVMQPTKFELVINLATARAFGFEVPPMLLAIADEVIE